MPPLTSSMPAETHGATSCRRPAISRTFPAAGRRGKWRDWGAVAGITQVINQSTQVNASLGYTRNRGYLANPYKVVEVAFIDPDQQFLAPLPGVLYVNANALLEQEPELRNQWLWNVRLARYIGATDAGLHVQYSHFRDDWGIRATPWQQSWRNRSAMVGP